jgi:chromatin remodeling complex protein RSC6
MEYIANFFKSNQTEPNLSNQLMHDLCSNIKRVNITKDLLDYISSHKLQDKNDTNSVVLDDTLAEYFNREVGQKLTYYEIQQLIDLNKLFTIETGFLKPFKLSGDLCRFLEMEPNSKLSRVDVTRKLCKYIDTRQLKDEDNKRIFTLDEKLARLFNNKVGQKMYYYEMQYCLQPHLLTYSYYDKKEPGDGYLAFE